MKTNVIPHIEKITEDEEFKIAYSNGEYFENYMISNYGRVYSFYCDKILSKRIDKNSYVRYRLWKNGKIKYISGHRLVAFSFCENPEPDEYHVVNHLDENPTNNKWTNLAWTDDLGNLNWATCQKRRAAQRAKKVLQFDLNNKLIAEYKSLPEIKERLGYNGSVICNYIKSGKAYQGNYWRHTDYLENITIQNAG